MPVRRRVPPALWLLPLLPRLLFWGIGARHPERLLRGDSEGYVALAQNLRHHGVFAAEATPPYRPDTLRTPGYPAFLVPFFAVSSRPFVLVALVQCLLGAWIAVAAWNRAPPDWGDRAALLAWAILSFDPVTLFHTPLLLTETLFCALAAAALWSGWRALEIEDPAAGALAGFWWSLATLTRPISLYLPLLAAPLLRRRTAAAFLAAAYLLPGLWIARNWSETGVASLSSVGGVALIRYTAAGVESLRTGRPVSELDPELRAKVDATKPDGWADSAEQGAAYAREATRILRDNPGLLAKHCFWGAVKVLGGPGLEMLPEWFGAATAARAMEFRPLVSGQGTIALIKDKPWLGPLVFLYIGALAVCYGLAIRGIWRLFREGEARKAGFLLLAIAYFVGLASTQGYYRYRMPVMPFLAVAAAAALRPALRKR